LNPLDRYKRFQITSLVPLFWICPGAREVSFLNLPLGSDHSIPLTEPPAVFDCRVLTLDEAALAQTSSECLYQVPRIVR
jgi:hypothetical protein